MMPRIYNSPDIRYSVLTAGNPPYTDDLKRAITKGVDSEGKKLEPPMPVWKMSDEDMNDLIAYIKLLN
ncbi:Uncharacterised protein [uncultured archaeon]|nr:Uncharacterised protein [uncultured archaeon]